MYVSFTFEFYTDLPLRSQVYTDPSFCTLYCNYNFSIIVFDIKQYIILYLLFQILSFKYIFFLNYDLLKKHLDSLPSASNICNNPEEIQK